MRTISWHVRGQGRTEPISTSAQGDSVPAWAGARTRCRGARHSSHNQRQSRRLTWPNRDETSTPKREMERPTDGNRQDARAGNGERGSEAARQQAERFAESAARGCVRATKASMAAASGAARSGSALAEGAQKITAAWARYAEEVMRHTSEAKSGAAACPDLQRDAGSAGQAAGRQHPVLSRPEHQNSRSCQPDGYADHN